MSLVGLEVNGDVRPLGGAVRCPHLGEAARIHISSGNIYTSGAFVFVTKTIHIESKLGLVTSRLQEKLRADEPSFLCTGTPAVICAIVSCRRGTIVTTTPSVPERNEMVAAVVVVHVDGCPSVPAGVAVLKTVGERQAADFAAGTLRLGNVNAKHFIALVG